MAAEKCECCGQPIPVPLALCTDCGHPLASHNDNGGKNKTAYCTVWSNPHPENPRKPHRQCECRITTGAP
jgi:predicted amidophosphoribosyltransferase